ncbi:MAG: hypothetical protein GF388_04675 [Candidatus Aegiribacteria sp.]|nr:hypothetical protein [Candidatus Aegiribacteria sp.]
MGTRRNFFSQLATDLILPCCVLIAFAFFVIIGCSGESPEAVQDGQIAVPVDTMQVIFEIGEEVGDSTNMFWSIASADIDDQGRILVLDNIDASVRAYDLQGNYIQQVTRRGPGPGELLWPRSLTVMPDGKLVICASSKGGYVIFDDSLAFEREIDLWENNSPYHISPMSSNRVAACRYDDSVELDLAWHSIAIYNLESSEYEIMLYKDSISATDSEIQANPARFFNFSDANMKSYGDGFGNVYFAPMDTLDYRIFGWDSLGNLILSIERQIAPAQKTPDEIQAESVLLESMYRGHSWYDPKPFQHRYMIEDVGIGPDGHLWVRRGTRLDLFFDIYDLEGNLLRNAVCPIESWSWITETTPYGILAWEKDPLDGYQKLYFLQ